MGQKQLPEEGETSSNTYQSKHNLNIFFKEKNLACGLEVKSQMFINFLEPFTQECQ